MSTASDEKVGGLSRPFAFFNETWAELKKISTPTRQETVQATMVVLVMMFFVSLFLWLLG